MKRGNDRLKKDRPMIHQETTSDKEWQPVVQRVTRIGTTTDNEWYNE